MYAPVKAESTSDVDTITFHLCAVGCQTIHMAGRRTGPNETKAYPRIREPAYCTNWGLPKLERPMAIATVLEYPIWQRSRRSSPRALTALTWRRTAVIAF